MKKILLLLLLIIVLFGCTKKNNFISSDEFDNQEYSNLTLVITSPDNPLFCKILSLQGDTLSLGICHFYIDNYLVYSLNRDIEVIQKILVKEDVEKIRELIDLKLDYKPLSYCETFTKHNEGYFLYYDWKLIACGVKGHEVSFPDEFQEIIRILSRYIDTNENK